MKKFSVAVLVAVILVVSIGFFGIEMLGMSRPFTDSGEASIPILMYHNVSPWVPSFSDENKSLTVKPEDFAAQMEYLHESGFTPITLKELDLIWRGKQPMPPKPIVLTLMMETTAFINMHTLFFRSTGSILSCFSLHAGGGSCYVLHGKERRVGNAEEWISRTRIAYKEPC